MRFGPDLLASRSGRLTAFFLLYIAEGIPWGFIASAVVTQLRRSGLQPNEVALFTFALYLPFAWKWAIGPAVDLIYSNRLGRRRAWIVAAQFGIIASLMAIMPIQMSSETVWIFVLAALCVSIFAATQDVAIDALACSTLREDERGTANGLMFAGAYLGAALGGSGVLILSDHLSSFNLTFIFVAMAVLSITIFVVLPLRETPTPRETTEHANALVGFGHELATYVKQALRAFFGSRASVAALVLAVLPIGTYSLSLFVQSNIAVELGLTNTEIGRLGIVTGVTAAGASALGGFLADRFGRRRLVAIYVVATAIPPALLAVIMQREGWIMPVDLDDPERMVASAELIRAFYAIVFLHAIFSGLIYGARIAIFMDVCNPKVAATQFTAYMAMMNLVNSYSSAWMGAAVMRIGYPKTFAIDIVFGMLCLAVLPFVTPRRKDPEGVDPPAA